MSTIPIKMSKTLKLTNVVCYETMLSNMQDFDVLVAKIHNEIKSKGYLPIGPMIQENNLSVSEERGIEGSVSLMQQANGYINGISGEFRMLPILKVKNCIYARFSGNPAQINIAQQKINVTAFEEGVTLSGRIYYVYLSSDEDQVTVDLFAECR